MSKAETPSQFNQLSSESEAPEVIGLAEATMVANQLKDLGLGERVIASPKQGRNGSAMVELTAARTVLLDPHGLEVMKLEPLSGQGLKHLFNLMEQCFPKMPREASTVDLLKTREFSQAVLDWGMQTSAPGNEILNGVADLPDDTLPCFYGSTSGLNFAEVLETQICAETAAAKLGRKVAVVFDHSGHENARSKNILGLSQSRLTLELQEEFEDFQYRLGPTLMDQRLRAADILLPGTRFVEGPVITAAMGENLTLGKTAFLGKLAGLDPLIFNDPFDVRLSDVMKRRSFKHLDLDLTKPLADVPAGLGGFSLYARDAVLFADTDGQAVLPLKMTTHANIYSILGRYGSLFGNNPNRGGILCPITKQRIQSEEQSKGGDPFDVTVLAFLAQKFPDNYQQLVTDFRQSCQVLSPSEAVRKGTDDNKFFVEDYFPAFRERRLSFFGK